MFNDKPQSLAEIIKNKKTIKPPAYPWQELALRIIKELGIPGFKRSAVFKICKEKPVHQVELALNDTKELCRAGTKWQYFFKIIDQK
ncbi:TPA: hypothetical protein DCZ15_03765 [Candidatus Falkowbacteria bacterium]|jgi:hypothetical protein|nr:MAG: hypothetical protein UV95_C0004G0100 [Candidatus Falkowbacteria bacterium GW2011_GWF2_43_32]HBA36961.1 hypothetical protein [Candidatus Falkowbacteria bacterium]